VRRCGRIRRATDKHRSDLVTDGHGPTRIVVSHCLLGRGMTIQNVSVSIRGFSVALIDRCASVVMVLRVDRGPGYTGARMPLAPAADSALRPPLKWAGGKRWQVPHLRSLWKPYSRSRLVEPFCGGLAVALGLKPAQALLNDANPHLVNFYSWLQRGLHIRIPLENDEALFYRHRARFNDLLSSGEGQSEEAAALFYYLNRTGFNGLCRFNRRGLFNVPFGRYSRIGYTRDFSPYRRALAGWMFISDDVE